MTPGIQRLLLFPAKLGGNTGNRSRRLSLGAILLATSFGFLPASLLAQSPSLTPQDFLKQGEPTFVVGTAGDAAVDRAIRAQAVMMRDLSFPQAKVIDDWTVDTARGPAGWPANSIVYGGPHVNHVLAKLGAALPFRLEPGKLTLGDQVLEGNEYRLLAVIPARAADKDGPGYPAFLLYAGTDSPGVTEINTVWHGNESILVADAFGRLLAGSWQQTTAGTTVPVFSGPRGRRIAWRTVDRELRAGPKTKPLMVHVRFPQQLPATQDEEQVIQACLRGLAQAAEKLGDTSGVDLSIYIYPDLGSIASLTGRRGDGHAVVEARVLHVVGSQPLAGGFEKLLVHEGTHVLSNDTWGAAGTPLLGEGLAVWASGAYGGTLLSEWKRRIRQPVPAITNLLGKSFRQMPENQSYPLAGILVEVAMEKVGAAKVRQHLYGAAASTWETACKNAGTTPQELEATFRSAVAQ